MSFRERIGKFSGLENPKYSDEQRHYMRRVACGATPFLITGTVFNVIFIGLVLKHTIDFSKIGKTSAEELHDIQSRIAYVLKFATPALLWLALCIQAVIYVRVRSPAMDPLYDNEVIVLKSNNILRNSMEQFVLSITSQLILVTHISPEETLKLIPALSFLFILGRITFWLGYPIYRSFGMITTMAPTLVTIFYLCYKFFDLYF